MNEIITAMILNCINTDKIPGLDYLDESRSEEGVILAVLTSGHVIELKVKIN